VPSGRLRILPTAWGDAVPNSLEASCGVVR